VKKANIETFVITESNRAHRVPYNQKLSSFNISSVTGYPHVLFVGSVTPIHSPSNTETVYRLTTTSTLTERLPGSPKARKSGSTICPGYPQGGHVDTLNRAQLATFDYLDWGFSILFLSSMTNARVQNTKKRHGLHSPQIRWLNFLRN